jgi:hypothetical protein
MLEELWRDVMKHETKQDLSRFHPLLDRPAGEKGCLGKNKKTQRLLN